MTAETERAIGQLQASVTHLEAAVTDLSGKVDILNAHMERQRGGWKALAVVGSAAGVVGGLVGKYF